MKQATKNKIVVLFATLFAWLCMSLISVPAMLGVGFILQIMPEHWKTLTALGFAWSLGLAIMVAIHCEKKQG